MTDPDDAQVFTAQDFAQWRADALAKADVDESSRAYSRTTRSRNLVRAWLDRKRKERKIVTKDQDDAR